MRAAKLALFLVIVCGLPVRAGAAAPPRPWIAPAVAVNAWAARDHRTVADLFGRPGSMAAVRPWRDSSGTSAEFGERVLAFRSEQVFALTRVRRGTVVMYDAERWDGTPPEEQRDPGTFVSRFVHLAHRRGLTAIVAPGPGLVAVRRARCGRRPHETIQAAFVRCDLAGRAAQAGADWFLLQAQSAECDPERYEGWVHDMAREAPGIVLAELSAAPARWCVTSQALAASWEAARPWAAGFAMWADEGYPRPYAQQSEIALGALRLIEDRNRGRGGPGDRCRRDPDGPRCTHPRRAA